MVQFYPWFHAYFLSLWVWYSIKMNLQQIEIKFRACLHEGGGPQVREVTCGGLPHRTFKRDQIKMRDYMDRWVTPPKRVTSPTWGPPPLCKQALKPRPKLNHKIHPHNSYTFTAPLSFREPLGFAYHETKFRPKQPKEGDSRSTPHVGLF